MGRGDQVKYLHHIALLQQQGSYGTHDFALRICTDKTGVGKHQIGLYHKPCLTGTAAAHDDLKQVPHMQPAVEAHAEMLREDRVVAGVFVAVLLI